MQNSLFILFIFLLATSCITITSPEELKARSLIIDSILVDQRDGKEYRIRRFGQLWWMIDNLNYDMGNNFYYENDYIGLGSHCPEEHNCNETGSFYDLAAATKACPKGWRLPDKYEWERLNEYRNCEWDRASPTKNRRDSMPLYEPRAPPDFHMMTMSNHKLEGYNMYGKDREDGNILAFYWSKPVGLSTPYIGINMKYCKIISNSANTSNSFATRLLMSCRCVRETEQ